MLPPPPVRGLFRTDLRARAAYAEGAGIFRILPAAVCVPRDRQDVASLAHWASAHRVTLVPRGAGSAMGGGNVGDGIIVDLTGLPRTLALDGEARRARAGASVTPAELNLAADRAGLRLPPDPSSGRWATLGGMISTNAAGARTVRYGSVRRWVESLELVTADGEITELRRGRPPEPRTLATDRFEAQAAPALRGSADLVRSRFPHTRKNSSGYALDAWLDSGDLLDLVVGAEGTLGFVTAATWRLDPLPGARAGLRVTLRTLDALPDAVAALLTVEPSAVELLDRSFLELVGEPGEAVLLVEIERDDEPAARDAAQRAARAVAPCADSVDTALTAAAAERLWALRHAASPILAGLPETRRSLQVIEDGCVPPARLGDYVRAVREAAAARYLAVVIFGHAGDGHVHVNLLPELARPDWEAAVAGLLDAVTDALVRLGGTPSGEHGDGRLRAGLLARIYGDEVMALFARVKAAFDPLGILNPGVILPSAAEPPMSRLKVGAGALPLPDDIARGLRRIEQRGGYAESRLALADGAPSHL